MKNNFKTAGIIISTIDVFDADRSFLIFTRELGKVRARAKGVRKPTSKLTGHLLPFMPTQLEMVQTGDFYLITQASCLNALACEQGLEGVSAFNFIQMAETLGEAIGALMINNEPYPLVYDGLAYALGRLRALSSSDLSKETMWLIVAELLMKVLHEMGVVPELENCVISGRKIVDKPLGWSSKAGGIFLQSSIIKGKMEQDFDLGAILNLKYPRTVLALRQLLQPKFVAEHLNLTPLMQAEVIRVVFDFVQYQIGKPLRSYQVVANLLK